MKRSHDHRGLDKKDMRSQDETMIRLGRQLLPETSEGAKFVEAIPQPTDDRRQQHQEVYSPRRAPAKGGGPKKTQHWTETAFYHEHEPSPRPAEGTRNDGSFVLLCTDSDSASFESSSENTASIWSSEVGHQPINRNQLGFHSRAGERTRDHASSTDHQGFKYPPHLSHPSSPEQDLKSDRRRPRNRASGTQQVPLHNSMDEVVSGTPQSYPILITQGGSRQVHQPSLPVEREAVPRSPVNGQGGGNGRSASLSSSHSSDQVRIKRYKVTEENVRRLNELNGS